MSQIRNRLRRLEQRQPSGIEPIKIVRTFVEATPDGPNPVSALITGPGPEDSEMWLQRRHDQTAEAFEARINHAVN
jgi:hypothetical protein